MVTESGCGSCYSLTMHTVTPACPRAVLEGVGGSGNGVGAGARWLREVGVTAKHRGLDVFRPIDHLSWSVMVVLAVVE
jgi:hypothetical protein